MNPLGAICFSKKNHEAHEEETDAPQYLSVLLFFEVNKCVTKLFPRRALFSIGGFLFSPIFSGGMSFPGHAHQKEIGKTILADNIDGFDRLSRLGVFPYLLVESI